VPANDHKHSSPCIRARNAVCNSLGAEIKAQLLADAFLMIATPSTAKDLEVTT